MRLFGHPIHPMLVHFPSALLPMDLLLSLLYYTSNEENFGLAALYCLAGGVAAGVLAILAGIADMLAIPKDSKAAWAQALYHGFINGAVILVFGAVAYKAWHDYPALTATMGTLILKAILVFALFIGNYMGGRLIYKYFIGIEQNKNDNAEPFT